MYTPDELLPHKSPMVLISAVDRVDTDANAITTIVTVTKDDIFFDPELNGVPIFVGIEYMAQTIGCYVGYTDKITGREPQVGFVLGSRKIEHHGNKFEPGQTYRVTAKESFFDNNIASFDCAIYDSDNNIVCGGLINVYRPNDIDTFIKGGN